MDELIIRNGSVIDGLTPARTTRTIAVSGSRIHPLEQLDNPDTADTIDAEHLVVAPGFIDVHTHDDRLVMSDPTMTPKVSQGGHDGDYGKLRRKPGSSVRSRTSSPAESSG